MSADAIVLAALSLSGLAVGIDEKAYSDKLYPFDSAPVQKCFCRGILDHKPKPILPQSGCGLTDQAVLRIAEVDGRIIWRGSEIDMLSIPYEQVNGQILSLLPELAKSHSLLRASGRPELLPGTQFCLGGDDGLPVEKWQWGGVMHVGTVTGGDGTLLETVEGGQGDPGNMGFPTAILTKHAELYARGDQWWLRPAGTTAPGRRVRWWYDAGALPCR